MDVLHMTIKVLFSGQSLSTNVALMKHDPITTKKNQHPLPRNADRILARSPHREGVIVTFMDRNDPFKKYTPIHPHLFTHIHTLCNDCWTIRFQHPLNAPKRPHQVPKWTYP